MDNWAASSIPPQGTPGLKPGWEGFIMANEVKNPGVAAVLSFVFSGLGQIYNGQITKGLLIIFFSALNLLVLIIGAVLIGFWLLRKFIFSGQICLGLFLFLIGLSFICILGIYSIIDAYRVASKK
jgi:TM2 domain-containing membrane protein YozV